MKKIVIPRAASNATPWSDPNWGKGQSTPGTAKPKNNGAANPSSKTYNQTQKAQNNTATGSGTTAGGVTYGGGTTSGGSSGGSSKSSGSSSSKSSGSGSSSSKSSGSGSSSPKSSGSGSSSSSKTNTVAVPSSSPSYTAKAANTAANPASSRYYDPNVSQASRYTALAKSLTAASKKRREEDEALGYSMSPYLIGGNSVNKNYSNQPSVLDRYNSGMKSGAVGGKIQGRSQTTGATYLPQNGQVTDAGRYLRIEPDKPTGSSGKAETKVIVGGHPVYNGGQTSSVPGMTAPTPVTPRPDYAATSGATYLPGITTPYNNPLTAKAVLDSWNNKKAAAANPAALPMYATQEQLDKAGIKLPGTSKAPEPGNDGKGGAGAGAGLSAGDLNNLKAAAAEAGMELTDEDAETVYDLTLQDSKDLYELGKEDLLAYINLAKQMNLADYQQTERALSNAGANTLFNIQQAQRNNFGAYTSPEMLGAILAANMQGNQSYLNDLNGSLQELLTLYYNNRRDLNDQVASIPTNASTIDSNIIKSPAEVRAQQRYGEYQGNVAAITDTLASKAMQNTALNWAAKGVKV